MKNKYKKMKIQIMILMMRKYKMNYNFKNHKAHKNKIYPVINLNHN